MESIVSETPNPHPSLSPQFNPIFKVPEETLLSIFGYAREDIPSLKMVPFELTAIRVCSWWRRVALESVLLWTEIILHQPGVTEQNYTCMPWWKNDLKSVVAIIDFYMNNSKNRPVSIDLKLMTSDNVLTALIPHASRWRVLTLRSPFPPTQQVRSFLTRVSVPMLESLKLDFFRDLDIKYDTQVVASILTGGAPKLRVVGLRGGIHAGFCPSLQAVTKLLLVCTNGTIDIPNLFFVLSSLPSLADLILTLPEVDWEDVGLDRYDNKLVTLPKLHTLQIQDFPPLWWISAFTSLPALTSCFLHDVFLVQEDMPAHIMPRYPTVRKLYTSGCAESGSTIPYEYVLAFPNVTTLILEDVESPLFGFSFATGKDDEPEGTPWPKLSTLVLQNLQFFTRAFLQELVLRGELGYPIQNVKVQDIAQFVTPRQWAMLQECIPFEEYDDIEDILRPSHSTT